MKKEYSEPKCYSIKLRVQTFCASFDSVDNTEKWNVEAEETI